MEAEGGEKDFQPIYASMDKAVIQKKVKMDDKAAANAGIAVA